MSGESVTSGATGGTDPNDPSVAGTAPVPTSSDDDAPPSGIGPWLERSTRPGWSGRRRVAVPSPVPPLPAAMEAALTSHVDAAFYRAQYPDVAASGAEPLRHYCRWGWREGRDPSAVFSTRHYLESHPDVAEQGINPLWHFLALGEAEGRSPHPEEDAAPAHAAALRPLFDPAHYAAAHPDVAATGADALTHYMRFGAAEARAPNRWFDAGFYRTADQTLMVSGINPLLHYARVGRGAGHPVRDPAPEREAMLRALRPAQDRGEQAERPASATLLGTAALRETLRAHLPRRQLVLSVSHDAYTREVGGTQILIADEQARFNDAGAVYLHLAPVVARLHLVHAQGPDARTNPLRATLDGRELGCFDAATLVEVLTGLEDALPARRLLVCHCLLGHDPADVARLHAALRPQRSVFWLHDYSSLCEGYNLLRNDAVFCAAPPPDSPGCRICVHGAGRPRHLRAVQALFEAVAFDVVAPSEAALATWRAGAASDAALPHARALVHPHAEVVPLARRRSLVPAALRGTAASPVRVAFMGHPGGHKGWSGFLGVLEDCASDPAFRFFHLGVAPAVPDGPVRFVPVRVTATTRDAMRTTLEEHAIDLALVLSPWPETFSFVTFEALAAGADVLALEGGGNVADAVLRLGRGVVFEGIGALRDFFVSGRAVEYVRLCATQGSAAGTLRHGGATATLPLPNPTLGVSSPDSEAPRKAAGQDVEDVADPGCLAPWASAAQTTP